MEWTSVDVALPVEEGQYNCACIMPATEFPFVIISEFRNGRFEFDGVCSAKITHWLPLPELPEGV